MLVSEATTHSIGTVDAADAVVVVGVAALVQTSVDGVGRRTRDAATLGRVPLSVRIARHAHPPSEARVTSHVSTRVSVHCWLTSAAGLRACGSRADTPLCSACRPPARPCCSWTTARSLRSRSVARTSAHSTLPVRTTCRPPGRRLCCRNLVYTCANCRTTQGRDWFNISNEPTSFPGVLHVNWQLSLNS